MKKFLILGIFAAALFLNACASSATLGNVSIPGGAQNVSSRDIGNNQQLSYLSPAKFNEACDAQAQIIESVNYKASGEPSINPTYKSITYTDNSSELTLMCSEEKEDGNYMGTKITLTLMKNAVGTTSAPEEGKKK